MRKRFQRHDGAIQALLDIFSLLASGFLSEVLSSNITFAEYIRGHFTVLYLILPFIAIAFVFDLYYTVRDFRHYRAAIRLLVAITIFSLILLVIGQVQGGIGHPIFHSSSQFWVFTGLLILFTYLSRLALSLFRFQVFIRNAIIIGDTPASRLLMRSIAHELQAGHLLGFNTIGYVAEKPSAEAPRELDYLGKPLDISDIRRKRDVTLMIYALDSRANHKVNELLVRERLSGVHLISAVGLYQAITGRVPHQLIDAGWLIEECLRSNRFAQAHLKKLLDKAVALFLGVLSLPVLLVAMILIRRESPGPAIFRQERIGKHGQPFTMYKLRTMREAGTECGIRDPEKWHDRQEARITAIGQCLRRTHIDEIPQLWNVLKGDMSLVGPRPEMEMFINASEGEIPFYRLRLDVKPGLTGWAQVAFRHTSDLAAYQEKFEYDLYYLSHRSLQLDLEIIARTVFTMLFKRSR